MNLLAKPTPRENQKIPGMNTRRIAPAISQSLPPQKKQKLGHAHNQDGTGAAKLSKLPTEDSQGSSSDQSATKWFDQVNKNIPRSHVVPTPDDEPPFFMSNQQNYKQDSLETSEAGPFFGGQSHNDSENADLRGVIDDLTVENKRLKQLLKDQRTQSSPESESQDKLFEIRLHGLPATKKRELESLLKTFAANVHSSAASASSISATHGPGIANGQLSTTNLTGASPGKKPVQTDSGYASNSNSGVTATGSGNNPPQLISKRSRDKNIRNYLHDIPDILLPRPTPFMTERAKMVLVVRRLEQLFTGKDSSGDRSQPIQQQEVSKSAARADENDDLKNKLRSRPEGSREADMMPLDSRVNLDAIDRQESTSYKRPSSRKTNIDLADSTEPSAHSPSTSPDQRPTRPLDLDIHRAQLAADNIEYIRHLGMSPHINKPDDADNSSWIYLNLMISLAQLHTINVTPSFIRKAIRKLSTKFELSEDGYRVRWKGGSEGTVFSKEEERALDAAQEVQAETIDDSGPISSKRSKTNSSSNLHMSQTTSEDKTSGVQHSDSSRPQVSMSGTSLMPNSLPTQTSNASSKFEYRPIVYNRKKRALADTYLDSSSSYGSSSGDSNGLVSALSRSNLNQTHKAEEGTITFFNNPHFYSDVSADNAPVNWQTHSRKMRWSPIGLQSELDLSESPLRYHDGCYFMPQFGPKPYQETGNESEVHMNLASISKAGEEETQPLELVASGLGGVTPEDNFALDVKVERKRLASSQARHYYRIPLTRTRVPAKYSYRTQDCQHLELMPSMLPPPNYIFFTSSSSCDDIDDMYGDSSSGSGSSTDEHEPAPPAFLNHWSTGSSNAGDADENNGYESSVDMLHAAKAADPVRVAAQEREYIINQPGGAVKIEGSLAATVGTSRSASLASEDAVDSNVSEIGESDDDMSMDD